MTSDDIPLSGGDPAAPDFASAVYRIRVEALRGTKRRNRAHARKDGALARTQGSRVAQRTATHRSARSRALAAAGTRAAMVRPPSRAIGLGYRGARHPDARNPRDAARLGPGEKAPGQDRRTACRLACAVGRRLDAARGPCAEALERAVRRPRAACLPCSRGRSRRTRRRGK